MTTNPIIARKEEQKILQEINNSNKSEFIAIYGRRRIGKTFLISSFFNKEENVYLEFVGLKKGDDKDHREYFVEQIASKLNENVYDSDSSSWPKVFRTLKNELNKINNKKIVIFIDELPRFCKVKNSNFLEHLGHLWESFLSKRNDIILVVSGSSASWMIEHLINETGTLYDRLSETIELKPFSLEETKQYLKENNVLLEDKNIAEIYMAIGGIPKYLNYIRKDDSFFTAINRLYFTQSGPLRVEFNKLFKSLYQSKSDQYKTLIIDTFSTETTIGKNIEEIISINKSVKSKNSKLSEKTIKRIVNDLVSSGFLMKQSPFKKSKGKGGESDSLYYLIDSYCIFYIYWVHNKNNFSNDFWLKQIDTPSWNSWKGIAFESVCLTHDKKIKSLLGIEGIDSKVFGWKDEKQIDLVIDRADDVINLFELKFYQDKFSISEDYLNQFLEKIQNFKNSTKTKKSIIPVMLTSYGCVHNSFYKSLISKEITLIDLMN